MFYRNIIDGMLDASYLHNIQFIYSQVESNLEKSLWDIMVPYHVFVQSGLFYLAYNIASPSTKNNENIFEAIDMFICANKKYIASSYLIENNEAITGLESLLNYFSYDFVTFKNFLCNYLNQLSLRDKSELIEYSLRYNTIGNMPIGYRSNHFPAHEVGKYHECVE